MVIPTEAVYGIVIPCELNVAAATGGFGAGF